MKSQLLLLIAGLVVFSFVGTLQAQNTVDTNKLAEIRAKAETGNAQAQCDLGSAYAFGRLGLKYDWTIAMIWFQKSAEQNNAEAECRLGTGYGYGVGLEKNSFEAAKWYRKSADQNFVEAYWRLGCCYDWAGGVPIDHAEAVKWFIKAAESNCFSAYQDLDLCYYQGRGASKDLVEAYKWCLLADEFCHSYDHYFGEWAGNMKSREAELSPDQIAEAKRRVNEWRVQHKLTAAKP
jgi:TPR repeat protein